MNNIHIQSSMKECKIGLCYQRWLCNLYPNVYANTNHMAILYSKSIKYIISTSRVISRIHNKGHATVGTTPHML